MFSRYPLPYRKTEKASAHQQFDRAARLQVASHLPKDCHFPTAKEIIHFEGKNGPDGLSSKKSSLNDEPWHFLPPNFSDDRLLRHIENHIHNLHAATVKQNRTRMSFEAAWMAHMIVDGLSPSHHQPFREQLKELDSRNIEELRSRLSRMITPGTGIKDFLKLNWKRMGPGGVGTNHIMFELGVEFIMIPFRPKQAAVELSVADVSRVKSGEYMSMYKDSVKRVDSYQMFERYEKKGWTEELARDVKKVMIPEMIKMISLGWLAGVYGGEK
ncbi:MAG: hypothetical protein LBG75_02925 [Candidatus Nomurabacteria bacterium]|jgi:hypothetical protein|nr:hypothetical protein [Candidatus Nomurabacteria bacterium]